VERDRVKAQIKRDEGTGKVVNGHLMPYVDTVGKITIGWGRNLTDRGISYAEAEELLENDLDTAIRECLRTFPWFEHLDVPRQAVLINMCFNVGLSKLKGFGQTLRLIGEGRYEQASVTMLQSKWAEQVGNRALRLSEQMRTGQWQE
jgi:lysozyme